MYEDDSSGRDILYKEAIDIFLQNPIFGKQFLLNNGTYSHNSILDVMMGLGFCGVLVWIYLIWKDVKLTYHHVFNKTSLMIIGLLSIQSIFKGFLSGAMYMDNGLAVCMIIILSIITDDYEEEEVEEDYEKND
jgi:O-antigen ligase